jgi:curved DNA-binding protein CbpA
MSDGETHYDVLGIEPGASKDEIRAAYQERLEAAQAEKAQEQGSKRPNDAVIEGARDREADVRKAWQVLSDPYQRGRYDATIEAGTGIGADDGDGDGTGEIAVVDRPAPQPGSREAVREERRRARAEALANRPPGPFSPEPGQTPASWPQGLHAPPNRARTLAMLVDFGILAVLSILILIASGVVTEEVYPKESKRIDVLATQLDNLDECIDNRPGTPANEPPVCREGESAEGAQLRKSQLERRRDRKDEKRDDLLAERQPVQYGALGAILVLGLLYLVPSTIISGRTFGKKLFQIRVVQNDGSKVRPWSATTRYATPILVTLLLANILGQLAPIIVLFGVLTWPRNPNKQSLLDRLAGTLVVDG